MTAAAVRPHPLRVLIHGPEHDADDAHVAAVLDAVRAQQGEIAVLAGEGEAAGMAALHWAFQRGVSFGLFDGDWVGPDRPGLVVVFAGAADEGELIRQAVRGAGSVLLPAASREPTPDPDLEGDEWTE